MSAKTMPNEMRQGAKWMRPKDDRILETLRKEGNMTPLALSREGENPQVDTSRHYAGDRCRELVRYGLVERVEKGLYRITDHGLAYLDEELDASTLESVE